MHGVSLAPHCDTASKERRPSWTQGAVLNELCKVNTIKLLPKKKSDLMVPVQRTINSKPSGFEWVDATVNLQQTAQTNDKQ